MKSIKKHIAIGLFIFATTQYFFPKWNGLLFESSTDITAGDGRIVAAILLVGGLLLWFSKEEK